MAQTDDDNDGVEDLSNKKMLQILLQEIADVRIELKEDIATLDQKLTQKIDSVDRRLSQKIDGLDRKVGNLTLKVDQNQIALMTAIEDLEGRTTVLEAKVG